MKNKKKIIFLSLLLILSFGFFAAPFSTIAQSPDGTGTCYTANGDTTILNKTECSNMASLGYRWVPKPASNFGNDVCTLKDSSGRQTVEKNKSEQECRNLSRPDTIVFATWQLNEFSIVVIIKSPPDKGTCHVLDSSSNTVITRDVTLQNCETLSSAPGVKGAFWTDKDGRRIIIKNQPDGNLPSQTENASPDAYKLLQPLTCDPNLPGCPKSGILESFDISKACSLTDYLNLIINLFIGLCAVAAVVMLVIAGIEYSTAEIISNKEAAKEKIKGAILGLILALAAYALLFTINPDLLNADPLDGSCAEAKTEQSSSVVSIKNTSSEEVQFATVTPSEVPSGLIDPGICDNAKLGNFLSYFIKPAYAFSASSFFCTILDGNGGIDILNDCGSALAASNYLGQEGIAFAPELIQAVYLNETAGGTYLPKCFAGSYDAHMTTAELDALARLIESSAAFREAYKISNKDEINKIPVSCSVKKNGKFKGHGGALGLTQMMPTNWERFGRDGSPMKPLDAMVATGRLMEQDRRTYNLSNTDVKNLTCKYFSSGICKPGRNSWVEDYGNRAHNYANQVRQAFQAGRCSEVEQVSMPPLSESIVSAIQEGLVDHYNPFNQIEDVADGCVTAGGEQKLTFSIQSLKLNLYNVKAKVYVPVNIGTPVVSPGTQSVQGNNIIVSLGDIPGGSTKKFNVVVRIKSNAPGNTPFKFKQEATFNLNMAERPRVEADISKEYRICKN